MNRIHRILTRVAGASLTATLMVGAIAFSASAAQPGSVTGDSIRLRSQPSTDSEEIGVLNQGDTLEILDSSNDTWYQVSYTDSDGEQLSGYVSRDLVTIGTTAGNAAVNSAGVTRTATLTEGGVNLRNEASTDSSVLTQIDAGSVVTILDDSLEGWIQVGYSDGTSNYTGYISSDYLYVNPMAIGVTTRAAVILREQADSNSNILALLQANTTLDIMDSIGNWYQVTNGTLTGYVEKKLLSTENDSQCIGYGTVSADSLSLRSEASTEAGVLTSLPSGATFQITADNGDGWYGAVFNGQSGYVSADYVSFSETVTAGYIQVTASSLTLRAGAGTAFAQLAAIPEGTVLTVCGSYGSWYQVSYNGQIGYVSGTYVSATTADGYQDYPSFAQITASSLTLRKSADTSADSLGQIANGIVVAVSGKVGDWYKVTYDGTEGYINVSFTAASDGPATVISHSSSGSFSSRQSTASNRTSSSAGSASSYEGGSTVSGGTGSAVADYAQQFYGNPYVWGGTSLTGGVDCSGFVMQVYAHFGYSLPHSSSAQRSYGQSVSLSDIQPGDIVCYNHHVGIYVGNGQIISALGKNYGITYSSVTYKSIITIRRIFS